MTITNSDISCPKLSLKLEESSKEIVKRFMKEKSLTNNDFVSFFELVSPEKRIKSKNISKDILNPPNNLTKVVLVINVLGMGSINPSYNEYFDVLLIKNES